MGRPTNAAIPVRRLTINLPPHGTMAERIAYVGEKYREWAKQLPEVKGHHKTFSGTGLNRKDGTVGYAATYVTNDARD